MLLTPPKFLNDPSEFRVRRVPASEEEIRQMFEAFGGGANFEDYKQSVMSASFREGEPGYLRESLSEYFGIVSLSEKPLDPLMWAHYAENSGVVVGYPATDETQTAGLTVRFFDWGPLWRVDYNAAMRGNAIVEDFGNVTRVVTMKGEAWNYEAEWRFIGKLEDAAMHPIGDKKFYTLPAHRDKIQRIIFGCEAGAEFKHDFYRWMGESTASIEEMVIDEDNNLKTRPYLTI